MHELRYGFHDQIGELHTAVGRMAGSVAARLPAATDALLSGDVDAGDRIVDADRHTNACYAWVEEQVFENVARQSPVARDLRFFVGTLRIAQEYERSGDLIGLIARRITTVAPVLRDSPLRDITSRISVAAARMLSDAAAAYRVLDAGLAEQVIAADDAVDELHHGFLRALFEVEGASREAVVELGLVARFYERLADHAVVVAERVRFIDAGAMDPGDHDR